MDSKKRWSFDGYQEKKESGDTVGVLPEHWRLQCHYKNQSYVLSLKLRKTANILDEMVTYLE